MEIFTSKTNIKFVAFNDAKNSILIFINFLKKLPNNETTWKNALKRNNSESNMLLSFRFEIINTLIAAMYSGRELYESINMGKDELPVEQFPDEEIAYMIDQSPLFFIKNPNNQKEIEDATKQILNKIPDTTATYLETFLNHFEKKEKFLWKTIS